jgi:hypothetical protein
MCVRRREHDDANLEAELCAYFVTTMKMDADAAREAARRWVEFINRGQQPPE